MIIRTASPEQSSRRPTLQKALLAGAFGLTFLCPLAAQAAPQGTHADTLGSDDGLSHPDYFRYLQTAYPATGINPKQSQAANAAFAALAKSTQSGGWQQSGYTVGEVPAPVTYPGKTFTASGRITTLATTPACAIPASNTPCRAILGAAGGGIWIANNPFTGNPQWVVSSTGLGSNAIGSIGVDPSANGQTLYAGTGEQNSSGDSEAGVGLFKSTDGGQNWAVMPASVLPARGLSVSSVIIDPRDPKHLYFGTATALHGAAASANPSLPPGTEPTGFYESRDGGTHFTRIFTENAGAFTGGVMQAALDPNDADTVYISVLGVGLLRASHALDGDGNFHVIYATKSPVGTPDDGFNRLAFATAKNGAATRIYVGDSIDADQTAYLYRTDNARVPASALSDGVNDAGWIALSSATPGVPGYASYNFCEGQCFYDIWVASPQGRPDTVWVRRLDELQRDLHRAPALQRPRRHALHRCRRQLHGYDARPATPRRRHAPRSARRHLQPAPPR